MDYQIKFKELLNYVQLKEPNIAAGTVKELINEMLDELSLDIYSVGIISITATGNIIDLNVLKDTVIKYSFSSAFSSAFGSTEEINMNVVQVMEVYLNDEKVPMSLTMGEFQEGTYSSNDYCMVGYDRKIYFPAELSEDDDLKIVAKVMYQNLDNVYKNSQICLQRTKLDLVLNYILKEYYLFYENKDENKHLFYLNRYRTNLREIKPITNKRLNLERTL